MIHCDMDVTVDPELTAEAEMASVEDSQNSAATASTAIGNGETNARPKYKAKRPTKQLLKQADSAAGVPGKAHINMRKLTRRPRNSKGRGLPKKGGGGGKHTWGKPGCEIDYVDGAGDVNDPNYDSDSQDNVRLKPLSPALTKEELQKIVSPLIAEYFEHGDTTDVIESLWDVNCESHVSDIPETAVMMSLDRHNPQRELVSILLSDMYNEVVAEQDLEVAFDNLLSNLDDIALDTPDAPTILGNFIARAVADDCLQPKYVHNYKGKAHGEKAGQALGRAEVLLSMKHGLVRLDNVWGIGGGIRPVKTLIKKMVLLLKEYLSSDDDKEAIRCIKELEVPHFHHELIYEAYMMVIEEYTERTCKQMAKLLKTLSDSVIVTPQQLTTGFLRIFESLSDICLDVPNATSFCDEFAGECEKLGFLTREVLEQLPSKGRKRFVSEGDGGALKSADLYSSSV